MSACMFHECGDSTSEEHEIAKKGFRFCERHREILNNIYAMTQKALRGMRLMDFWGEARPDYKPDPNKLPKHSWRPKQRKRLVVKSAPKAKASDQTWAAPKAMIDSNAFSLAGLINEEVSKLSKENPNGDD